MTDSRRCGRIASATERTDAGAGRPRRVRIAGPVLALAAVTAALAPASAGAQVFRYVDDSGTIVWTTTLPPEYATRGYEVFDPSGRLIREVAPQLTAEELAARERELEEERRREALEQEAFERDQRLLRLYSSVADVDRALERRLRAIDNAIGTTRGNIERLRSQQRVLEAQAAEAERAGQPVGVETLRNLEIIERQIVERRDEIEAREAEKDRIREAFMADAERVRELYSRRDG
jgi:hypothetical protein